MVYSCKKEVDRARNDRDDARRDADKFKHKYNKMTDKYNSTHEKLINTTNKLTDTKNKLTNTKNKLTDTTATLNATTATLNDTNTKLNNAIVAYSTQTDEVGYLTNRINVSEYFSVKEGLNNQETDTINSELKNIDRNSYNAILDQNSQLATEIEKYRNEYSTDDQKVNYEQQTIYLLLKVNYVLKWMYYFLFLFVIYFLYYTKYYSIYVKFILVIILAIYPIVIYTIEQKSYDFFNFLWSFVHPQ